MTITREIEKIQTQWQTRWREILGEPIEDMPEDVCLCRGSVPKPPTITHSVVHTNVYFRNVAARLRNLNSATAVRAELQKIARELTEGTFEY